MAAILEKFERRALSIGSLVCVGLDPDVDLIPSRFLQEEYPLFAFNRWVIEQTHAYTVAYKPNMAFFEARGVQGLRELELTVEYLRSEHPDIVTICDAKRGDIGNTNRGYVASIFDAMGFDAVTVHPYLGREALLPFLEREDKACIVLCRTSNPGAGEFQDLEVAGRPLWEHVAERVSTEWNTAGNCMLVVGATYPDEMRRIRAIAPEVPFLVPGVGAQGGDAGAVVAAGADARGLGLIISSSRGILFSDHPAEAAMALRNTINAAREKTHAAS
jgi:orotidine-5'-phosphate decarboxylase